LAADPFALAAMLDFRHHSVDGRLDYWTTTLVEEFLSSYALGLLFRYLHTTGLAAPACDSPAATAEAFS
jgi:hypothetical protein